MTTSASDQTGLPGESEVREALRYVIDPEVGVNVVDLGLVYHIGVSAEAVQVDITMTSPACPMGEMIMDDAREVVDAITPAGMAVEINLVWEPPWDPSKMSDAARRVLGW